MKQFSYNGVIYNEIPDPLVLSDGSMISPVSENTFIQYGGDVILTETAQEREFREACRGFRELCYRVRPIVGDDNWRGSIDEIRDALTDPKVISHPDFQFLSTMLTWYDKECTYLGGKIGLGQPAWWFKCWEYEQEEAISQLICDPYTGEVIELPYEEELNPYDTVVSDFNPYEDNPYDE